MSDELQVLHAADLHIDSPMRGLSDYDGAPAGELRGATRVALTNLVDAAIDRAVRLVVLAGDVFDGDWPDYNTGLFYANELDRLGQAGIDVVVVSGNHDAASQISRSLQLPPNVTTLSADEPQRVRFDDLDLEVVGQSYATRDVQVDLAAAYPMGDPALCTIGLLHTALTGREGHANYAPCSVETLRSKGYQYWALGHVHTAEVVHRDPWIVFPGNLQGRNAREVGPKGARLLRIADRRVVDTEAIELDIVRWARVHMDAAGATDIDDVLGEVMDGLEAARREAAGRLLATRVVIGGASEAHHDLHAQRELLTNQIRLEANRLGQVWVEKVQVSTRRPLDLAAARADDAVGELALRVAELRQQPETLETMAAAFTEVRKKIAADVRSEADDPLGIATIGTADQLADLLDDSLELIVELLAEERA